ncbi:hypothetical protein NM208_g8335 [Fusarium decemcellulare]|uniref:Uncharacterized protein n=1 Tax=Fusarium decemcellulare TaxID=57161 RepID=A0ACC1S600_9HYPO|nr:hypothetical protein NM208_g8335 [Fusarium decemcellulare]
MTDMKQIPEQRDIKATRSQSVLPESRKASESPAHRRPSAGAVEEKADRHSAQVQSSPSQTSTEVSRSYRDDMQLDSPTSSRPPPGGKTHRHASKFNRYMQTRNSMSLCKPESLVDSSEPPRKRMRHRSSSPQPRLLGETTFQYRSLDSRGSEIRLLRILPDISTRIQCQIFHTPLNIPHDYIAISYTWGDPLDTRLIVLDGHEFPITTSLWHALSRIRSVSTAVIVWADAICINQHDLEERSYQVGLMTSIYQKASMVALWLGPEANDSYAATELLCELAECNGSRTALVSLVNDQKRKRDWKALVDLFERDYWRRLWVVQEIFSARKVTIFCGNSAHPWQMYLEASKLLRACKVDLMRGFHLEQGRQALSKRWVTYVDCLVSFGPSTLQSLHSLHQAGRADLFSCLLLCAGKLCRDPRDKLYALLGILSENDRSQFKVNYKLDPRHVYTDIVDYVITKTGNLDVICCASNPVLAENIHMLPSWVPDWSHASSWRRPLIWTLNGCVNAARDTKAPSYLFSRRRKLSIMGIVLGTADFVGYGLEHAPSTSAYLMAFLQCCTSADVIGRTYQVFTRLLSERYEAFKPDETMQRYARATPELSVDEISQALEDYFKTAMKGRKFLVTASGLLCLASDNTSANDIICVGLGCSSPIVLRQHGEEFEIVGDCYVDGYMDGRALDEETSGSREKREFVLI